MKKLVLCALVVTFVFCGTNAFAVSYGFLDVGNKDNANNIDYSDTIELKVKQNDDKVTFVIKNIGDDEDFRSSIAAIYIEIDEASIDGDFSYSNYGSRYDVSFSEANRRNPPPRKDLGFQTDILLVADRPGGFNGINVDEKARFHFSITSPDFNIFDELRDGNIRIAVKLDPIFDRDEGVRNRKDVYIASTTAVPEPATMLLLGAGLIGIAGLGRKKLFKKK